MSFQVHTPQRPFECTLCSRRYRQSSTLVMHKRTAHALVDSDDGGDVFLQDSFEPSSQNKKKTVKETVSMIQYSTYYLLLYAVQLYS